MTGEYASPLGTITMAGDGQALTGLWLAGQKYFGSGQELTPGESPVFRRVRAWLDTYFAGVDPGPLPPIRMEGSDFQLGVWGLLRELRWGQTTTYGAIAERLSQRWKKPVSAQAVGGAVGHNPISILVPCHRVVGSSGGLTGYAGGVDKKLWLLRHEGVDVTKLSVPAGGSSR